VYLKEVTYHMRLFRGPSTNDMKKVGWSSIVLAAPEPLFTPPPVSVCARASAREVMQHSLGVLNTFFCFFGEFTPKNKKTKNDRANAEEG